MFNIGGGELLVILLVALIVLGPDKLPQAARQVGRFTSEARKMADGFRSEMKSAMDEVKADDTTGGERRLGAAPSDAVPIEDTVPGDDTSGPSSPDPTGNGSSSNTEPSSGSSTDETTGR